MAMLLNGTGKRRTSRSASARSAELRLVEHVERIAEEHPPIDLGSVDYTIRRPGDVRRRYGRVLDYMARVELEVDRNVLELTTLLPDPPEVDRHFYADVWRPQEIRHGQILDEVQRRIGRPGAAEGRAHWAGGSRRTGAGPPCRRTPEKNSSSPGRARRGRGRRSRRARRAG
jgi:hypothetical protein